MSHVDFRVFAKQTTDGALSNGESAAELPGQEAELRETLRSHLVEATGYEWPKLVNDLVCAILRKAGAVNIHKHGAE